MANLIKIDKNGSKHYEGYVPCDRCGGDGVYKWGAMRIERNGAVIPQYSGTCFKCEGSGKVFTKWIERTPEYQAKLDAKRAAKHEATRKEREAKEAERMAQWLKEKAEREAAEAKRRAISQYVGNPGEKIQVTVKLEKTFQYEAPSFNGFGTDTKFIYTFVDENGNKMIWNTGSVLGRRYTDNRGYDAFEPIEDGNEITIKATIKGWGAYKGERQTELQRVKIA